VTVKATKSSTGSHVRWRARTRSDGQRLGRHVNQVREVTSGRCGNLAGGATAAISTAAGLPPGREGRLRHVARTTRLTLQPNAELASLWRTAS
jgi:hypothetical protein